ncbi:hypothetical protein I79_011995 [Cricetulus griseus]|uniref:Uncharacterized protein n=1 Tax=Cricetulus griseus TaxID=10029 RepID=G3HMM7_CRIGR|nr:hypothetical protein I79_011995 [Cricetulus griseus]
MASYVDNSFRQAVMKNPAERTPQVRRAASSRGLVSADCALPVPRHSCAEEAAQASIQDFPCPNFQGHSFQTVLRLLPSPLLSFTLHSLWLTLLVGLRDKVLSVGLVSLRPHSPGTRNLGVRSHLGQVLLSP